MLGSKIPKAISRPLNFMGTNTLGIYAIHLYFILCKPYVAAAIPISLTATKVLEKVPPLATLLLGKQSKLIGW